MSKMNKRLVRERLANWESRNNPLTALSTKQKDTCIQISSIVNERRIPTDLPKDEGQSSHSKLQEKQGTEETSAVEEFQKNAPQEKAETAQAFLSWYSDL
eukprot:GAHX01003382.1.p1 GENE.GAHX01003382.1~~GAHX01003382.1.p1  ORF type:complete len:100 (-),score=13.40 GAHX01003382.1:27-326(-)